MLTGDCWKNEYINYLNTTTKTFQDLHVITQYDTMEAALTSSLARSHEDVWSILHIQGAESQARKHYDYNPSSGDSNNRDGFVSYSSDDSDEWYKTATDTDTNTECSQYFHNLNIQR